MIQKIKQLSLFACLAGTTAFAQQPPVLFQDDFTTSEPDGSPSLTIWGEGSVSGTVDGHQGVQVTNEDSASYFEEADNGYLHIYSDGTESGSYWLRTTNEFAGSNIVSIHFDYQRSSSTGDNDPGMRIGQGNPIMGSGSVRYMLRFQENAISDEPVVQDNVTYNFQFIYNNTALPVTYLDGEATLQPDSYDVWIDSERVITNGMYKLNTSGVPLEDVITSLGIGVWSGNQTDFRMDNLVIYDGAYAIGNPPPPPVPTRIFADDFSTPVDGITNRDIWVRGPYRLSPPNRVLEITDNNSETYFGEAGNNYMRMFHDGTTTKNFHLTGDNAFDPASNLITISFDFFEPSGVGEISKTLQIIPGVDMVNGASQIHRLALANGSISGVPGLYQEGVKNNFQIIFNNTAQDVTYLDGTQSVTSDTYDVWVNGQLLLDDHTYSRGSHPLRAKLSSVQLIIWGGEEEVLFDNFEVFNYPYVNDGSDSTLTFADWAAARLPEGLRGEEDDASGDGITNLMKFFLGVDPLASNRDKLPTIDILSDGGQEFLTLTTQHNTNADIQVTVEASTDLTNWTDLEEAEPELLESLPEGIERVRITDTEAIDGPNRRFLRLRISEK